ncbi:hypothetical protein HanPI659440_Chr04g0157581 [Helianthus annuus]|nr:hypothetical protein HanPI659440_Chr04g0157581 [Helianthus annuus]
MIHGFKFSFNFVSLFSCPSTCLQLSKYMTTHQNIWMVQHKYVLNCKRETSNLRKLLEKAYVL